MIATLTGTVAEKLGELVVIDVNGIGYGVYVTVEDSGRLQTGQDAKVYVYEHIRESSHDLFGFVDLDTKLLFELLLSVNGVGPKGALGIMSIGNASAVRRAIAGGDVKFISTANGVGKRVAERVVVDLKDKVGLIGVDLAGSGLLQADSALMEDEAIEALVALGYTASDAAKALHTIDKKLPTEDRVKLALKGAKLCIAAGVVLLLSLVTGLITLAASLLPIIVCILLISLNARILPNLKLLWSLYKYGYEV